MASQSGGPGQSGVKHTECDIGADRSLPVNSGKSLEAGRRFGYNPKDEGATGLGGSLGGNDKEENGNKNRSEQNNDNSGNRILNKNDNRTQHKDRERINNSNDGRETKKYRREYKIENTVSINLQGKTITLDELVESVERICGIGTLLACVENNKDVYDLTLVNQECKEMIIDGLQINDQTVNIDTPYDDSLCIAILRLPAFISDDEIAAKLGKYNINIVTPVKRQFHSRLHSKVANGTRHFRIKLPQGVSSLPWSLPFDIRGERKYYKVKHDNQKDVCYKCLSDEHLARKCPDNVCYSCNEKGHISVDCPNKYCPSCERHTSKCICKSGDSTTESEVEDTDNESSSDTHSDEKDNSDGEEQEDDKVNQYLQVKMPTTHKVDMDYEQTQYKRKLDFDENTIPNPDSNGREKEIVKILKLNNEESGKTQNEGKKTEPKQGKEKMIGRRPSFKQQPNLNVARTSIPVKTDGNNEVPDEKKTNKKTKKKNKKSPEKDSNG